MKVAGTVFVFLLALNTMGPYKSKSATAGSLTLRFNSSYNGVFHLVFEVLRCIKSPFAGMLQMLHYGWHSTTEVPALLSELLFQLVL